MVQDSHSKMDKDYQISVLRKHIEDLRKEIESYKKTLDAYDIDEVEEMSDIEYVCVSEIKKLKKLSDGPGLDESEVKKLDMLHKNLRMVRNQPVDKKALKTKASSVDELLKIVNGGKDE